MEEKQKKPISLYISLAGVMSIPIIILGIVLVILGKESVTEGMEFEIKKSLASTAREAIGIVSLSYPGEMHMEGDAFYIGETELTENYKLLDQIKDNTGCEISLFLGNTRMLTTIEDGNGERFVYTETDDQNILGAIAMGNDYYSDKVLINGVYYYGYYAPVRNGSEISGMLFAGMTKESVQDNVKTITAKITLIFFVALLGVLLISSLYVGNIVKCLNQIREYIGSLASNHFDNKMSPAVLKRTDEIGDMGRHAQEVGQALQTLIYKDPLTGLYNRRAGRIELDHYMDRLGREQDNVTVALGDIDFFKKVNDTYGHDCGDIVLKTVSEVFQKYMDKNGAPIRWGGEEFLLAFKKGYDKSLNLLEEMLNEIRAHKFVYEDKEFYITMTFGITRYKDGDSIDAIVKRADELLYDGKTGGRNRIVQEEK